jgi:hypothetical protein
VILIEVFIALFSVSILGNEYFIAVELSNSHCYSDPHFLLGFFLFLIPSHSAVNIPHPAAYIVRAQGHLTN